MRVVGQAGVVEGERPGLDGMAQVGSHAGHRGRRQRFAAKRSEPSRRSPMWRAPWWLSFRSRFSARRRRRVPVPCWRPSPSRCSRPATSSCCSMRCSVGLGGPVSSTSACRGSRWSFAAITSSNANRRIVGVSTASSLLTSPTWLAAWVGAVFIVTGSCLRPEKWCNLFRFAGTGPGRGGAATHEETVADVPVQLHAHEAHVGAVGRRVVHGGARFVELVLIDDAGVAQMSKLAMLAPLHQTRNLVGGRVRRAPCFRRRAAAGVLRHRLPRRPARTEPPLCVAAGAVRRGRAARRLSCSVVRADPGAVAGRGPDAHADASSSPAFRSARRCARCTTAVESPPR